MSECERGAGRPSRILVKWLLTDGQSAHGEQRPWPMPRREPDGAWTPGETITGRDVLPTPGGGLLLSRVQDLFQRREGTPHLVECLGDSIATAAGVLVTRARALRPLVWASKERRLFAADCAARALAHESDPPIEAVSAIDAARRYANGGLSLEQLQRVRQAVARVRRSRRDTAPSKAGWVASRGPLTDGGAQALHPGAAVLDAVLSAVEPVEAFVEGAALFAVEAAVAAALHALDRGATGHELASTTRQSERRWQSLRKWGFLASGLA